MSESSSKMSGVKIPGDKTVASNYINKSNIIRVKAITEGHIASTPIAFKPEAPILDNPIKRKKPVGIIPKTQNIIDIIFFSILFYLLSQNTYNYIYIL